MVSLSAGFKPCDPGLEKLLVKGSTHPEIHAKKGKLNRHVSIKVCGWGRKGWDAEGVQGGGG